MKKDRAKGRWLRQIGREKSPSPKNKAAFAKWVEDDDRFLAEQHRDIRHIVDDHKPRFLSYLAREGFTTAPEFRSGEWHRVQQSTVLLLREAYDVEPIAFAVWRALKKIEDIEAALSAGDTPRACAASFRLGRLMQEADAHFAVKHTGGKNRKAKMSKLFEYTKAVWSEGKTVTTLLADLPKKYANWDSRKGTIRWRDAQGRWRTTKDSTFERSLLPKWKKLFREQVKNGSQ
jgi:hypothetical protein